MMVKEEKDPRAVALVLARDPKEHHLAITTPRAMKAAQAPRDPRAAAVDPAPRDPKVEMMMMVRGLCIQFDSYISQIFGKFIQLSTMLFERITCSFSILS